MVMKVGDYQRDYRVVSLAFDEEVKEDLRNNELDFLYITDKAVILYPDQLILSEDPNVIELLKKAGNYDVYGLSGNGRLIEYYDDRSIDNYFFITGKCNSNCVMCPSPDASRKNGESSSIENLIEIAKHIPSDTPHLTITGGEPFMVGKEIFRFILFLREKFTKTELLFLTLFVRMLKTGGRCACIVPDGVLFGSSKAHKDIRKAIVEEQRLEAVISMPSGVFKPYAGVSTAILIFTKTGHGGTDKVWFYDMKADGRSLDDKRSEVKENDIPDIIARFKNLEAENDRKRTDQSFFVEKQEIVDNAYDLSINKYKEIEYIPVEYPPTSEIMANLRALEKEVQESMAELEKMLGDEMA